MRKLIVLLALMLALVGCGGTGGTEDTDTGKQDDVVVDEGATEEDEAKVINEYAEELTDDELLLKVNEIFENEAAQLPDEVKTTDGEFDSEKNYRLGLVDTGVVRIQEIEGGGVYVLFLTNDHEYGGGTSWADNSLEDMGRALEDNTIDLGEEHVGRDYAFKKWLTE